VVPHHGSDCAPFGRDSVPLESARAAFEWLVTGPYPLSIDGRFFPGLPTRRVPLDELRELLLDPDLPLAAVDRVWRHLVTRSRDMGDAWTVACVGVALPALFAIAYELGARFAQDHSDLQAAILTGFLSELASVELARPGVLWRLRCAALREGHLVIREALERPTPWDKAFHSREPRPPWGHEDILLVRAVAEGVITKAQADLIGTTRLEPEYTLHQAAADWGVSYDAIAKFRRRAERRLAAWLLEQPLDDHPSDPSAREMEIRAVHAATITAAAREAARPMTHRSTQSHTVPAVGGRSSKKVRGRMSKKAPKTGVDSCGRTPAAPAHTTPAHPASRHHPAAVGSAAMRLTRSPLRHHTGRRGRAIETAGRSGRGRDAAPLAAAGRVRWRGCCVSRPAVDALTTPAAVAGSVGQRTVIRRRLTVITGVAVLAVALSTSVVMPVAHAETVHATMHVLALAGSIDEVLTNIRTWVMGILAGLATVFLSIGGVRYVMGGGDPGEIEKAKTAFKAAGIGYGLAALAPLVVTVLQGIVGT